MNNENNKRRASACEAKKKLSYQRRQYIISGFAAFLTLGSLAAYIMVSISQGDKTRESLKLTERSINLADSNFIIENRAWVTLQMQNPPRAQINMSEEEIAYANITWTIYNLGKTPAENVRMGYYFCTGSMPTFQNRKIVYEPAYTLAPDEERPYNRPYEIRGKSIYERVESGKTKFLFYGIITYNDIYGRSDTTEFLFAYATGVYNAPMTPIGTNRIK